MKPFPELTYEELLAEGYALVGSPESVTARLVQLYEQLGFGQIIGLFSIGDITHEQTITSMELFATQVMPAVRSLGVADRMVTA
jgi:alkanesulfonate monooxygenase SsuD/methylene tetrahydromethanopterin reductase-like flavin-dependent oxidoreductase (luciferase family)